MKCGRARSHSISPAAGSSSRSCYRRAHRERWVKVVQRLPVKIRLLPHDNEGALRAGMTATVDVDTLRQRSIGQTLSLLVGRGSAKAAGIVVVI